MSLKKSLQNQPTLLIDADLYLYRACAAAEQEVNWGDDVWSLSTDLKVAKATVQNLIQRWCEKFETVDFVMCISDRENFRKEIYPSYKGNRKGVRKPVGYKALVQWARDVYVTHTEAFLEADDVMGILGTTPDTNAIIISDDKDMKTLPGRLFRPVTDESLTITKEQADASWYLQCLTGDTTDGYAGLPGVGPKTAEKILGQRPTWEAVLNAYVAKGMTYEDALVQSRLARILRYEDWDQKTSTINLWEPEHVSRPSE